MSWVSLRGVCLACGSAAALTVSLPAPVRAQRPTPRPHPVPASRTAKVDRTPSALMPVENVWGLALNNGLTMPPAFEGTRAFLSIEGDRLVAYDLLAGTRTWMVAARPELAPVAGGGLVYIREADALRALRAADGSLA